MFIFEQLFNVVAPHECIGCLKEGSLLCDNCIHDLPAIPSRCYRCLRLTKDHAVCGRCQKQTALDVVWASTPYEGVAKELLYRLKFGRAQAAAATISKMLKFETANSEAIITYIPTANSRVRERGYDQAELIAKALAARLKMRCLPLLARIDERRQLGQDRAARQAQASEMFRPINSSIQNKEVIIVDDVLTTGATCEAAALVLKTGGAKSVSAVVFAAVDAHSITEVKMVY